MPVYHVGKKFPKLAETVFVAPNAQIMGDVVADDRASFWFGVVVRGDNERIHIGAGSNIQENSVLHVDEGFPISIGKNVTVGHRVVLHGCTIEDDSLIGMGAIVMNGAKIGRGSIIAAGAVLLEKAEIPPFSLVVGSPGKVVKTYTEAVLSDMKKSADHYMEKAAQFRNSSFFDLLD